jgi:hypothetical protein
MKRKKLGLEKALEIFLFDIEFCCLILRPWLVEVMVMLNAMEMGGRHKRENGKARGEMDVRFGY